MRRQKEPGGKPGGEGKGEGRVRREAVGRADADNSRAGSSRCPRS